jgi:acyl-coenzyme A synthetase/AMP-(fatty) acid ligase
MDPQTLLRLDRNPEQPMLLTPDGAFSRGQLARRAAALGDRLRLLGVGGEKVIVSVPSGAGFVSAVAGSWFGGATPVLLDPLARHELLTALEMTGAKVVIVDRPGDVDLPPGVRELRVDESERAPAAAPTVAEDAPLIYLFTSGSTGTPTLVPKNFAQLKVEIDFLNGLFGFPGRVSSLVPWCHIFGFIVSFLVPVYPGAVCDLTAGVSSGGLLKRVAQGQVDLVVAVPAHYQALVRLLSAEPVSDRPLDCRFATSGAPLDPDLRARFTALTGCPITDLYGSTEAGGVAYRHDDGPWLVQPHVAIQVDRKGFLSVRSPSVSFGSADGFYPMGDLVTCSGDGFVLEGREDDVVKIGGRRAALGEVQNVLERCPAVRHAAVLAETVRGVNRIVAFIEPADGFVDQDTIKRFVRERLADHKVPRVIRLIDAIPRTPAGKVNRQALKAVMEREA